MQGIDNTRAGGALSSLSDVNISSPAVGDLLIYNGSEWINDDFAEGHTILNESGTAVTDEANLQFTSGLKVTDDDENNITKVEVDTTFTEAETRTNIASGDTFSTILGKIKKWFSDLASMFVSKSGDTMSGTLAINGVQDALVADSQSGTGGVGWTFVKVGNNKASNVDKNSAGVLRLYGITDKFADFFDNTGFTANRNIYIPDKTGTIALTSDIPDVSGKVNRSGDTMTGELAIYRNSEAQATFSRQNTGTSSAASNITLGNNIADGTTGSTYGRVRIYGKGAYKTDVQAPNATANRTLTAPDGSGTIALTSDIPSKVSQLTNDSGFITSSGTAANVSGTVAIANGGTGATTRLGAAKNLTDESVPSPGYVVSLTQSWGKFGYSSLSQLKSAMSLNNVNNTADANKAVNVSAKLGRNGDTSLPMTFNWSGATGQPPWVWGGSDGANMYVYNPSNFNVNSATISTKDSCPRVENKNLNSDGNINGGTSTAKFSECGPSCSNLPDSNWYFIISMGSADSSYGAQIAIGMTSDFCWVRRKDGGSWKSWRRLI